MAEKLSEELDTSKIHVSEIEKRFQEEKEALEKKCTDFEQEVKDMKQRVEEMAEKRKGDEEVMKKFESLEKERDMLKTQKTEREEALEEKLARAKEEGKDCKKLQDKIAAMEQVVAMYHEKARGEIKEFAKAAEEANEQEALAREELQECLVQLESAEEDINAMMKDMQNMKHEMEVKDADIHEMEQLIANNDENERYLTAAKAKEHQHMREKKKWMSTEKNLRDELDEVQREHDAMQEDYDMIRCESDQLHEEITKLEEENEYLTKQVKSMKSDLNRYKSSLETNDKDNLRRIQSLEKELIRAQSKNHGRDNDFYGRDHRGGDHEELDKMKNLLRKKEDETRQAQEMAKAATEDLQEIKRQMSNLSASNNSISSASQYNRSSNSYSKNHYRQRSSPTYRDQTDRSMSSRSRGQSYYNNDHEHDTDFHDDTEDEEVRRYTSNSTKNSRSKTPTPTTMSTSWDEMDNPNLVTATTTPSNTGGYSVRSNNSKGSLSRANSVTPDSAAHERERRTIENDAIRTYMRQRRRKNMQ